MVKKMAGFMFLSAFLFMSTLAYANGPMDEHQMGKGTCSVKGGQGHMGRGCCQGQCPVAGKVLKKAHMALEHRADLGLTDDQVKTISDLKLKVEKDGVAQNAEKETFMLDLSAKLKEDTVDVAGIDALIDKNFASMSTAIKSNVDAYAKLKSVLTPEQQKKLKELWGDKERSWKHKEK
jgi:Spy/CpxP family protein refolding chaperone